MYLNRQARCCKQPVVVITAHLPEVVQIEDILKIFEKLRDPF
jgi:hypothetical protein